MSDRSRTFRIAVRKFGPFESAIAQQWESFAAATGCALTLEAVPLDLHPLHDSLFVRHGLQRGDWDVAFINTDWLAEAHGTRALTDLSSHLPADYPDAWSPSLLRAQQFDRQTLGLPYHDGPECLIYRTDLIAKPPVNWDEFIAIAGTHTSVAQNLWGTAFAAYPDGHNTVYDFSLQLWTRGAELFDSRGRLLLDQPAGHAALQFYRKALNSPFAHPDCRQLDSVAAGMAFARGEIAMMVNWFGFAAMCQTIPESAVKGRVAIAPIPSAPGCGSASLNVYWILGVAAGSPHQRVAVDFVKHCSTASNDKLLTLAGGIGCRRSTWHDADVNRAIPFYSTLEAIHEHARELPRLTYWSRLSEVIDRMMTAAIASADPVESIARLAQQQADELGIAP